jgi:hypothetical protein
MPGVRRLARAREEGNARSSLRQPQKSCGSVRGDSALYTLQHGGEAWNIAF